MIWNNHSKLNGFHAPYSPSSPSWLNYDDNKLLENFENKKAAELGTRIHAWAKETIDLGIKQPKSKNVLSEYVNDAIGYKMDTEVLLYYSDYYFGTADAISFRNNLLRIHDLKTGKGSVHMEQVLIYAALFCLEYKKRPRDIDIELRIYQFNQPIDIYKPTPEEVDEVINIIVHQNNILERYVKKED